MEMFSRTVYLEKTSLYFWRVMTHFEFHFPFILIEVNIHLDYIRQYF